MAQVTSSVISPTIIHSLSDRFQEPQWARERREEAYNVYQSLALPGKDESWRNLRLQEVPLHELIPCTDTEGEFPDMDVFQGLPLSATARRFRSVSEVMHLDAELEAGGVIFTSLQEAIREHEDLVENYFGKLYDFNENKFSALHYALCSGGFFLYVPQNVVIDRPIQLVTYADQPDAGVFSHTVIVAEENAHVHVIDYSSSFLSGGTCIHSSAVEIFAAENAKVSYTALQNFDGGVYSFTPRRARLGDYAEMKWSVIEMGARLVRSESTSFLEGEGASSDAAVIFFADGKQTLDVSAGMIHAGNNGTSMIEAKGMMQDCGRTIWRGLGHIKRGAKNCKTYQSAKSLILSEEGRGDAIPGLLIEETDVLGAGHAATVGQIDAEQLFYIMSRGLSPQQANRMIVEGFFGTILERIPVEAVRNEAYQLIQRKLGDGEQNV